MPSASRGPRVGEGVQFGEDVAGFGRADPLEYLQRLPQQGPGLGGVADGDGAAAHPKVADAVYARLTTTGQADPSHAAEALHHALRRLRDTHLEDPLVWAPYIHIGP